MWKAEECNSRNRTDKREEEEKIRVMSSWWSFNLRTCSVCSVPVKWAPCRLPRRVINELIARRRDGENASWQNLALINKDHVQLFAGRPLRQYTNWWCKNFAAQFSPNYSKLASFTVSATCSLQGFHLCLIILCDTKFVSVQCKCSIKVTCSRYKCAPLMVRLVAVISLMDRCPRLLSLLEVSRWLAFLIDCQQLISRA